MKPEMIEVNTLGIVERICLFSLSVIVLCFALV